ncbi:MAG: gliding motility-associated C-terminal domain-containing protein [Flavobacteriales bacterium]|nr:gliding motility-associated C-terminal domain-containing protein [Flavobacteriales bacterium]
MLNGHLRIKFFTALIVLLHSSASAQEGMLVARFEPGCELVNAYFGYSGNDIVSYAWDLGDGSTSTLASPMHVYPYGTIISVSLTTVDSNGETAMHSAVFPAQEQLEFSQIEMPNIFTPNGDGHNDVFTLLNERSLGPCAQLSVFNRYGQRIFESVGNNLRWDGRSFAGEEATAGVYFYVFTWGGGSLSSTVTLVR